MSATAQRGHAQQEYTIQVSEVRDTAGNLISASGRCTPPLPRLDLSLFQVDVIVAGDAEGNITREWRREEH